MKRNNENLSLGDVLKEFVSKNNLEKGLDKVHVRDAWNQQMGPAIQKYTTAIKLQGTTLYVQLSYGKEKIVKMLNEELGKELIEKLVLR